MPRSLTHRLTTLAALLLVASGAAAQSRVCDVDADTDIDRNDVTLVTAALNQRVGANDLRDPNGDGLINSIDVRACTLRCSLTNCAVNSRPTANAGPDQAAEPDLRVTLDGSASSDADGGPLPITYAWRVVRTPGGVPVTLGDATAIRPSFTPRSAGDYEFELRVADRVSTSLPDHVVVTTANVAPVADAGPDRTVARNSAVQLDAGGSRDANGDLLSYQWLFLAFPGPSAPALEVTDPIRPTFLAATGRYELRLTVRDPGGAQGTDTVVITTEPAPNTRPTANAGANQSVPLGAAVTVSGSASSDPEGTPLVHRWSMLSQPAGSTVVLPNPGLETIGFTAARPGTYQVQLVVSDGELDSLPDVVTISTTNTPPVAVASAPAEVTRGDTVPLDGRGSSDPDGDGLVYRWAIVGQPGSPPAPSITDEFFPQASFVAERVGTYAVQLTVTDSAHVSAADTVSIRVNAPANRAPVAGADAATTAEDTPVTIDVLANDSDPDVGDLLTVTGVSPAANGSTATDGTRVTFTPAANFNGGPILFTYTVSDGRGGSATGTVSVTVTPVNDPPVARDDAASTPSGSAVTIDVLANDDDVDAGTVLAIQSVGTPANGTATIESNRVRYLPRVGFSGTDTFTYVVTDGTATATATVTVAVGALPVVTVVATDAAASEQGAATGTYTITRTGPATAGLAVDVAFSGSAANGVDFQSLPATITIAPGAASTTLTLTPIDDLLVEGTESAILSIQPNATAYVVGSPATATIAIADDDAVPTVTIVVEDGTAGEAGPDAGSFRVTRAGGGGTDAAPLSVSLAYAGTALNGVDYQTLVGSVTIPANATSALVTVTPVNDALVEGAETVQASLLPAAGYTVGSPGSAVLTIVDDEPGAVLAIGDVTLAEGHAGTTPFEFTVTLTPAAAVPVTVQYATVAGTATEGVDYVAETGTLSFDPGVTSRTVTVPVTGDVDVEPSETFTVRLSGATGATIADDTGASTIQNDDTTRALSIADASVDEGNTGTTPATFVVSLDSASPATITVDYATQNGSAEAPGDYATTAGTLTFLPGTVQQTITVNVVGDTAVEAHETFAVVLSNANANATLLDATAVGTIRNDDLEVRLTLSPSFLQVPVGQTRQMTVSRSVAAGPGGVLVNLGNSTPATATFPATVTIPAGATQAPFTVTAVGAINAQTTVTATTGSDVSASATVQITGGGITVPAAMRVGRDLQEYVWASLPAPPPSPVTVTLTSNNANVTLVPASTATVAGSASISFANVSSQSRLDFVVQGRALGTSTITVSAPGYADGTFEVTVDPSGFAFYLVYDDPVTSAAPGVTSYGVWSVRLEPGTLAVSGSNDSWQRVRGGLTVDVPVTSSVPARGTITNSPLRFGPNTSSVNASFQALSPDPATNPDTVVAIAQPAGFSATTTANSSARTSFGVEVTGGTIAINSGQPMLVGNQLHYGFGGRLQPSSPTGRTVTLTVPPGSGVLLSASRFTVGSETLTINDVSSDFYFDVQGAAVSGAPVTVTATTAADYAPGTGSITITPSAFVFSGVATDPLSIQLGSNLALWVYSVRLNPVDNSYAAFQSVRALPTGQTITVPIANSDPTRGTVTSPLLFAGGASWASTTFTPLAGSPPNTTLTIQQPAGFTVPTAPSLSARGSFAVSVHANVPVVTVDAVDPTATEAGNPSPTTATFRISRTTTFNFGSSLIVPIALSGTATWGSDYTSSGWGSVTIPANTAFVDLTITPLRDNLVEATPETVVLTLSAGSGYVLGTPQAATVTIVDDPPVVTLTAIDSTAAETGGDSGTFRFTRSGGLLSAALSVHAAYSGTATVGPDFSPLGSNLGGGLYLFGFGSGQTTLDVTLTPINDTLVESPETATYTLAPIPASYVIGVPNSGTVTITSDE